MRIIIGYVLLYFLIVFGSTFISSIFKEKIEKTIPINLCSIILILYIFGIFNFLEIGLYFTIILEILLGIIAIIKEKKNLKELILTPGLVFFTIIYFIFMITTLNKQLIDYDHFLYRSMNTKNMYYNNTFLQGYTRFYVPASNLIQYFFLKVIGTYLQGIEAFAMQILGISLLLPIFENVKKSRICKIIVGIIIVCIPSIFRTFVFYESSYPDATIGLLMGYIIYTYFTDNNLKYKTFSLSIISSTLVLMKPSGIAMSLILICVSILYEILNNKYILKEKIFNIFKSKTLKSIAIIFFIIILTFISFEIVEKKTINLNTFENYTTATTSEKVVSKIQYIFNSITTATIGTYNESSLKGADSIGNFASRLERVVGIYTPIRISLMTVAILFIGIYIFYYYKTKDTKFKYQAIAINIGFLLHTIFIMFFFMQFGSTTHDGIDRYFPPYLLAMLYFIIGIILYNCRNKQENTKIYVCLLIAVLLITPISSISNATITSGIYNVNSIQHINIAKNIADKINEYIEDNEKVITISQSGDTELRNLMLRYYLYPEHNTSVVNYINTTNVKYIENLANNGYKYIYIFSTEENLNEAFKELFNINYKIEDKTLYKIRIQDVEKEGENRISLEKVLYIDENI